MSLVGVDGAATSNRPRPGDKTFPVTVARLRGEGTEARRAWRGAYVRRAVALDWLCAAIAASVGLVVRFGPDAATAHRHASFWMALALPFGWALSMLVARAYE